MAYILTIIEPIWPMLQNISKCVLLSVNILALAMIMTNDLYSNDLYYYIIY